MMKLTKARLISKTRKRLIELGYFEIKDTLTGANGLFAKQVEDNLFLTLGLVISRFYDSMFTGSYYLASITRWGTLYGDMPKAIYQRAGKFLNLEERYLYLDNELKREGVVDAWWNGNDVHSISNFIKTIEVTERRFIEQKDIKNKIDNSSDLQTLADYAKLVENRLINSLEGEFKYNFIPEKPVDDVPILWFKAAERVLFYKEGILNKNTVKMLGADARRQYIIKGETQNNG